MAISFVREGATMRVEWRRPLAGRIASLVFLAPALYLGHFLVIGLWRDLFGGGDLRGDLPGFFVFLVVTLAIATPGYVLATFRYFVDIDTASGEIVVNRRFGPLLHLRVRRQLSEFTHITIVRDLDPGDKKKYSWFPVNLCGGNNTKPIKLASFKRRKEANEFGEQIGAALALKAADLADTEADDPDLSDEAKVSPGR